VELSLFQTGTHIFASGQQVTVFSDQATGTVLGHPTMPRTLCGATTDGNDSFDGTFTSATQASFVFYDPVATLSGQYLTFDPTNTPWPGLPSILTVAAGFSINGPCFGGPGFGGATFDGFFIKPLSGTYAGMLNGRPVILTMNQGANYSLTASGTDNATAITLSGQVIGGAFFVSDGGGKSYTGFYDPHANNFLVYDGSFTFLGQLHAGNVP